MDIEPTTPQDRKRQRLLVLSFVLTGAVLAVALFAISAARPGDRPIIKIAGIDAVSYYAVSRSLAFDHDFDLTNEYAALKPVPGRWNSVNPLTGVPVSPFPVGYSLLQVVFILLGAAVTKMMGGVADGYSQICITFYYIGNIVYVTIGLVILFHWLRGIAQTRGISRRSADFVAWIVTVALWPATTLGYYTFSSMSHAAAFATFAAAGYAWWNARDTLSPARWGLFGLLAGLNFLCRWQDALLLLAPVAYELMRIAREGRSAITPVRFWVQSRVLAVIAFVAMLTVQLFEWKAIFGSYLTVPQGQDMITLPPKHVAQVLFSSHNGWFTWTPIVFLGVVGLLLAVRRAPELVIPILVALGASVAFQGTVLPWHGYNYAMRMLTSSTALVAVGLVLLLAGGSRTKQVSVVVLMAVCGAFTIVFGLQYRLDALPKDQRLTFDELVVDKLRLPTVLARRRALVQAQGEIESGHAARGVEILQAAQARYGADRNMLSGLVQAYQLAGDPAAGAEAMAALQAITDTVLF